MYQQTHNLLPHDYLKHYLTNSSIHTYQTRRKSNLHIEYTRTTCRQNTVRMLGPCTTVEHSPNKSQICSCLPVFKRRLKKLLLSNFTFNHWNYSPPLFYAVFCNWAVCRKQILFSYVCTSWSYFYFDMHAKRYLFILKISLQYTSSLNYNVTCRGQSLFKLASFGSVTKECWTRNSFSETLLWCFFVMKIFDLIWFDLIWTD